MVLLALAILSFSFEMFYLVMGNFDFIYVLQANFIYLLYFAI